MRLSSRQTRAIGFGALGVLSLAVVWEGYKLLGPPEGISIGETVLLPRTTELAMPHVWDSVARAFQPASSASGELVIVAVAKAAASTLGIAGLGMLLGAVVGVLLALLMQRFLLADRAMLPWLILSQTVPLIALAPLVVAWGGKLQLGPFEWERWMSVAVIASYLAFFPVAIGTLRGLRSPEQAHLDLFRAQGAGWWKTLRYLRLPAAVPHLLAALRLGTATAIIGTVVAEVSTGARGGIGRLIVEYAQSGSSDPAKAWAPIAGAVVLGLVAAGAVALAGLMLHNYRRAEAR
ncbi:NitT/TauT family transport system permease protein [Agrococcus baldri]|uniref:NitT/TauT family transport system permease protein n=1 Tax=Agrococcus baldri TaxID=153730 RepID=A0AA94HK66_9MICO|nr:ABC transporter permease subunit [Agrococcus baldri]SFR98727.1 NitT/TauT family transport system permease protein [Agrococcus baldri]